MKKTSLLWMVSFLFLTFGFYACEQDFFQEDIIERKGPGSGGNGGGGGSGGGGPKKGELYGDLYEIQFYQAGVPVFGRLPIYDVEEEEEPHALDVTPKAWAHVNNFRLHGNNTSGPLSFTFTPDRNADGTACGTVPLPEVTMLVDERGYIIESDEYSFLQFYNLEGEILPEVAANAYALEFGRLNLVRSPEEIKTRRMAEVIANFGNGTVAKIIRDYCGRLFMVRTEAALEDDWVDKPIDSPLENLAIYFELMTNGFDRSYTENGLKFMIADDYSDPEKTNGGNFNFMMRMDSDWESDPFNFTTRTVSSNEQLNYLANLAAAGLAAGSDKFGVVSIQEVVFVNQALGIPEASNKFPVLTITIDNVFGGEVKPLTLSYVIYNESGLSEIKTKFSALDIKNVTSKNTGSNFLFKYNREKFKNTLIRYRETIYDEPTMEYTSLDAALNGEWADIGFFETDQERYDSKNAELQLAPEMWEGVLGFANQADDYVQALLFVHDYELMLDWAMPTPTWEQWSPDKMQDEIRVYSPFAPTIAHEDGSTGGSGHGGNNGPK